jgi:hypothetical protein
MKCSYKCFFSRNKSTPENLFSPGSNMLIFRVFGRLLTRFFGRLGRFTINIFKFIGRHETVLGGVVVAAALVGGIWLLLSVLNINIVVGEPQAVVRKDNATPAPANTPRISNVNAPKVTEDFMNGQIYFNADAVWNSLDPQFHNRLARIGRDKEFFVRQLTQLKDSGIQYQEYRYIGGYDSGNGQSIHFYVARYLDSTKKVVDEPFTFVVASQGKILDYN